jgi:hypothetical protein
MTTEQFKNVRDEQFWFTAAVVGFDGVLMSRAEVPAFYAILSAALVTLFGVHLIMGRWAAAAGRAPEAPPDYRTAGWRARSDYTLKEVKAECRALLYVMAEMSGSCFYLLLMALSFIGVICKYVFR